MLALILLRLVIVGAVAYTLYQLYWFGVHSLAALKLRRLAAERGDMSGFPHFQIVFPEFPAEKLRYIYSELMAAVAMDDFPVLPTDRLEELGLSPKEVHKILQISLEKYGGNYVDAQKKLANQPVQTASDVVNWIGQATSPQGIENGSR